MSGQSQIILVDNLKVRKINLQIGENFIGNDPTSVPAESESAVERAVKIGVTDGGEISITPLEGISCYLKSYGSLHWRLLKLNETKSLRLRDTCLLYPIKIWFRVISTMEVISEISKRKVEEIIEDEPPDKKYCSEYSREVDGLSGLNNNTKELNVNESVESTEKCENDNIIDVLQALNSQSDQSEMSVLSVQSEKIKHCNESNVDEPKQSIRRNIEPSIDNSENSEVHCNTDKGLDDQLNNSDLTENQEKNNDNAMATSNEDIEIQSTADQDIGDQLSNSDLTKNQQENNDYTTSTSNGDDDAATTVNVHTVFREKCKYGSRCYRLNAEHKAKFSHVGDDDYDIPDNRPECPYGTNCYRINPLHKEQYKHTQSRRQAAINSVRNISQDSDSDQSIQESVDESDYEQSFIDDDDIDSLEEFESDFEDADDEN